MPKVPFHASQTLNYIQMEAQLIQKCIDGRELIMKGIMLKKANSHLIAPPRWLSDFGFNLSLPPRQEIFSQSDRMKVSKKITKLGGYYTFSSSMSKSYTTVIVVENDLAQFSEFLVAQNATIEREATYTSQSNAQKSFKQSPKFKLQSPFNGLQNKQTQNIQELVRVQQPHNSISQARHPVPAAGLSRRQRLLMSTSSVSRSSQIVQSQQYQVPSQNTQSQNHSYHTPHTDLIQLFVAL